MRSRCRHLFHGTKPCRSMLDAAGVRLHQQYLDNTPELTMAENTALPIHTQDFISRRISIRIRANGIVALNGSENPVVTRVYDIGAGGLSFLYASDREAVGNKLTMDILLFDVQSEEEVLVAHINGRIVARELIVDPERNAPVWRYSVEFLNLEDRHRRNLTKWVGLALERSLYARQNPMRKVA